jgi:fumarate hydratase class II
MNIAAVLELQENLIPQVRSLQQAIAAKWRSGTTW